MLNTTVISILKTFSKGELKEFDKFIISPFFNNQPSLTRFYEELKKNYPGFEENKIDRKKIFRALYPDKEYSDDTIRRLTSDLKKLMDQFIYVKVQDSNPVEARFLRSFEFSRRGLMKEAEKELEQIIKTIGETGPISAEYIKNRLDYEDRYVQINLAKNKQSEISHNFKSEVEFLIYHFILRLSYYIHNIRVNQVIFNVKEEAFVNDFVSAINLDQIDKLMAVSDDSANINKAMRIYVLFILNYIHEKNERYFVELKQALPEAINYFQDFEKYNIYQMAEAICWQKMTRIDRERYRRELFEINKLRLDAGVYLPDGRFMRLLLYRQILNTALQLGEVSWAENFVAGYSDKLPDVIRENMTKYANAHLLFERGDFEGSLAMLNKVDFDIFTLKFDVRNLTLRIYIELNFIEEALSLIDTYKHFVAKNKGVSEYYRNITENFLKYCKNIIDLRTGKAKLSAEEMRREIEADNSVNFKSWLIDKLG